MNEKHGLKGIRSGSGSAGGSGLGWWMVVVVLLSSEIC